MKNSEALAGRRRSKGAAMAALLLAVSLVVPAAGAGHVFMHVNVITLDDAGVLDDQHVVVTDGRIARIGPADEVELPDGHTRIDARGAWLLPGLTEMHAHVPPDHADEAFAHDMLRLFLAHGVTTVRGMLGAPWHLPLRDALAQGKLDGPRLYTSGPSLNGNSVESPEAGRKMVREQAAAGYDLLKIHPGLSLEAFRAIAGTADEEGIPFAGHVPEAVGVTNALAAGMATIDHLDGYVHTLVPASRRANGGFFGVGLVAHADAGRIPAIARATRDAGVAVVPTETLMVNVLAEGDTDTLLEDPALAYMPESWRERWAAGRDNLRGRPEFDPEAAERFLELRRELLAAMYEAGVEILFGSDAPQIFNVPGASVRPEMATMEAAGMSRYDILASATRGPARHFGADDVFGRVATGLEADLVLVAGNPLDDLDHLRHPVGVMSRGEWYDRQRLDALLESVRRSSAGEGS